MWTPTYLSWGPHIVPNKYERQIQTSRAKSGPVGLRGSQVVSSGCGNVKMMTRLIDKAIFVVKNPPMI